MPNMARCEGCGSNIDTEKHSAIKTPKLKRVIGHVHKSPNMANQTIIPYCHQQAFKSLQEDYPVILIEDRLLNAEIIAQAERHVSRSIRADTSAKYAVQRRGAADYQFHQRTHYTIPSSY